MDIFEIKQRLGVLRSHSVREKSTVSNAYKTVHVSHTECLKFMLSDSGTIEPEDTIPHN